MDMSAPNPQPAEYPLEVVELELALQAAENGAHVLPEQLQAAIDAAGGEVLFDLSIPEGSPFSWMAAVSFGAGDDRRFAIVSIPADGGPARVEAAEASDLPVARIAAAYAGVLEHLRPAA